MSVVLAIAPHPDDETLGCGGTLLRHGAAGDEVHWLVVTDMLAEAGFSPDRIAAREREIEAVARAYGFAGVHRLRLPAARLDTLPLGDVVAAIAGVVKGVSPEVLYLPFHGDIHSDHAVVFAAAAACTKWFRYPSIRRVLAYETLSETDMAVGQTPFQPTVHVDIAGHLDRKIEIMGLYEGESGTFPFPRSPEAIRAQAALRGTACGHRAAECFQLLKEIL
jgi:N-acetylglucosamine malate deacetylase 1